MLLADMGADVIRLDRTADSPFIDGPDPTLRGRQTIAVDLKSQGGRRAVRTLARRADALIEGFRPGVMERLGLGPEDLWEHNRRLVYGRVTGWGQEGPLAEVAGHDINYISLAGALGASRRIGERPMFALNLLGDYGGGAMFLAFGVVCALLEAARSGRGQVVDAAMVDGVALMTTLIHGLRAAGAWPGEPGANLLDSGAHFYEVYETADGGHVAVGALEPKFYERLLELLEIPLEEMPQFERDRWPEFKRRLADRFAAERAGHWQALLEGEETCATVVRGLFDAHEHPHLEARGTFVELAGIRQPAPAPRFSRSHPEARPAQNNERGALVRWGLNEEAREIVRSAAPAR
jgi:alpha-methylacyl-CoA racemase